MINDDTISRVIDMFEGANTSAEHVVGTYLILVIVLMIYRARVLIYRAVVYETLDLHVLDLNIYKV